MENEAACMADPDCRQYENMYRGQLCCIVSAGHMLFLLYVFLLITAVAVRSA